MYGAHRYFAGGGLDTGHDLGRVGEEALQRSGADGRPDEPFALRQQGKQARSTDARDSAYRRIEQAVNELGPHLFPLIASAEQRVIGTRPVPDSQVQIRCNNYEVHGVIDVLTHVTLSQAADNNLIRQCVMQVCPNLKGTFEVIVDYKGARRPKTDEAYWEQGEWQVQTYAWLRQRQPDALAVAAGMLIYINELTPGGEEMRAIGRGLVNRSTDVLPQAGSQDEQIIRMWREGMDTSQLSLEFRLRRAIRVYSDIAAKHLYGPRIFRRRRSPSGGGHRLRGNGRQHTPSVGPRLPG